MMSADALNIDRFSSSVANEDESLTAADHNLALRYDILYANPLVKIVPKAIKN
jgi:hypothetical protein